eukprot:1023617-Pelagomonas_calceolata.AAC.4
MQTAPESTCIPWKCAWAFLFQQLACLKGFASSQLLVKKVETCQSKHEAYIKGHVVGGSLPLAAMRFYRWLLPVSL